MNPCDMVEAEAGPLLLRAFHDPCVRPETCGCAGIVRIVASVPKWGLDRWALVGDSVPPALSADTLEDEYSDPSEQEAGARFVAAFGLPWATLDARVLDGQRQLWEVPPVREWLADAGTTCEQLFTLRRFVGDKPSAAARAIVACHDYRRCTW